MDIISKIDDIRRMLEDKLSRLRISANQIEIIHGISDISKRLGLFQSGELRFGNHAEPGKGFTGVRIGFPTFTYSSTDFVLAVVVTDAVVWGITYAGALYFSSSSGMYGTWTPTGTAGTNITTLTTQPMNYIRIGNQVSFSGLIQIEATATGVFGGYLSIPIASDFTLTSDASGTGSNPNTSIPSTLSLRPDTTNNRIELVGYAQDTVLLNYRVSGGYIIR